MYCPILCSVASGCEFWSVSGSGSVWRYLVRISQSNSHNLQLTSSLLFSWWFTIILRTKCLHISSLFYSHHCFIISPNGILRLTCSANFSLLIHAFSHMLSFLLLDLISLHTSRTHTHTHTHTHTQTQTHTHTHTQTHTHTHTHTLTLTHTHTHSYTLTYTYTYTHSDDSSSDIFGLALQRELAAAMYRWDIRIGIGIGSDSH